MTKREKIAAAAGAAATLLVTSLVGCSGTDTVFINSADQFVNQTVGPEYLDYVEADSALTEVQKDIRRQNVDSFRRAVVEAQGGEGVE